jgi:hypothetical protein
MKTRKRSHSLSAREIHKLLALDRRHWQSGRIPDAYETWKIRALRIPTIGRNK